jgi:ABC-2 type transport system permease protein
MRHLLRNEWRGLSRQAGFWILLTAYVLLLGYGALQSIDRVRGRATQISAAREDYERRWAGLRAAAEGPPTVWGDWKSASLVGGPSGFAVTWMPVDGLAALSAGESGRFSLVKRVSIYPSDEEPPLQNPLTPTGGLFDLSFVVAWLLPLVLLAATHGVISGDRQQGTWSLLAATTSAPGRVLAARLLWPAIAVVAATVSGGVVAVLVAAPPLDQNGWIRLGAWCVLVAAYAGFWTIAAGVATARSSSAPFSLGVLGLLWMVVVWVVPGLIDEAVTTGQPSANRVAAYVAVREIGRDLDQKLPRMLDEVYIRHPQWRPTPDVVAAANRPVPGGPASRDARRVYVPALAGAEIAAPFVEAETRQRDRAAQYVRYASVLSPALAFVLVSDHLAGMSAERFVAFERHAADAGGAWQAFFAPKILQLQDMTRADMDATPTPPPFMAMPPVSSLRWPLVGIVAWTLAAGVLLVRSRAHLRA